MNGSGGGGERTLASWLHALLLGLGAIVTQNLGHDSVATGAIVIIAAKVLGTLILRYVRPHRRRVATPFTKEMLETMQGGVHSRIHRVINILAVFQAEIDVVIDDAKSALDSLNGEKH